MKQFLRLAFVLMAFGTVGAAAAFARTAYNHLTQHAAQPALSGTDLSRNCNQQKSLCDLLAY